MNLLTLSFHVRKLRNPGEKWRRSHRDLGHCVKDSERNKVVKTRCSVDLVIREPLTWTSTGRLFMAIGFISQGFI